MCSRAGGSPDRTVGTGRPPAPEHWPVARDHLPGLGALAGTLAPLRVRGRVYMTTDREPETGESWIAFALHPRQSPRETLAAINRTGVWAPVAAHLPPVYSVRTA